MTTEEYTKIESEIRRELFEVKSQLAIEMLTKEEFESLKKKEIKLLKQFKQIALEKARIEKNIIKTRKEDNNDKY